MISLDGDFVRENSSQVKKALTEKISCRKVALLKDDSFAIARYRVRNQKYWANKKQTQSHGIYFVKIRIDRDGQWFGECDCPAGTPPVDPRTGLWSFLPRPCYHLMYAYLRYLEMI